MGAPAIMRATGLKRYDIERSLRENPALATLAELKAAVVARKAQPRASHRPTNRNSLLWNELDRSRRACNKTGTK